MTKQEMFNKAYIGLASQGWKRCLERGSCSYGNDLGHRCAWGWVDTTLSGDIMGPVRDLRDDGIGLAASLSDDQLEFAGDLQACHDEASDGTLKDAFRRFARRHRLAVPVLL